MKRNRNLRQCIECTFLMAIGTIAPTQIFPAAFQNLDFEAVVQPLVPIPNDFYMRVPIAPIANALPGWQAVVGINAETRILYNNVFLGSSGLAIYGPPSSYILQGNYT